MKRGHTLALSLLAAGLCGAAAARAASTPLVVRRLPLPAASAAVAPGDGSRTAAARSTAPVPRMRAVPPPPLNPAGRNAGPAAWRAEMEARIARDQAFPHRVGPPGYDWSPGARALALARRARQPLTLRNPSARAAAAPAAPLAAATLKVAYIRIEFEHDRGGGLSSGDGRFDLSGPDTTAAPIDRPPHNRTFYQSHLEALRRYYDVQSYGGVALSGDLWPRTENGAYRLNDMADFGPWAFSFDIYGAARDLFRAEVFAADSQSVTDYNDRIPWDDYDAFVFIHAGSDLQSDLKQDSPEDIPTFTLGVAPGDEVVLPGVQYPIFEAIMMPETVSQDGFYGALNGVMAHESGHLLFGFADLYDVFTGRPVVGYWSLMDSGNLVGAPFLLPDGTESFAVGLLPPSIDPFHRFFMPGPLVYQDATPGDTVTVRDSERHPDIRQVLLSSDEYLLIENRAIAATDSVPLDQDSTTRVVLGPKFPDRYEYDALLPSLPHDPGTPPLKSGGLLTWHIDASRIPFETALRIDPFTDYGFNTDPLHPAISVVEADGLADLGDGSSPFLFGSAYDPYFRSNNRRLSDTTVPSLVPFSGTRPHTEIGYLDDPDTLMRMSVFQDWRLTGWPVAVNAPDEGPLLLAVDADGAPDRHLEVCWAGGRAGTADSTGLFAVRLDGKGMLGGVHLFASMDRRPRPLMAALPTGDALDDPPDGPSWFAVSTYFDPSADTLGGSPGGQVWLLDPTGLPRPGWPAVLPSVVTTPPVISGLYPNAQVFVGCADGRVYELGLDGTVLWSSSADLLGGASGRLAVWKDPASGQHLIAAGGANGRIAVYSDGPIPALPGGVSGWPQSLFGAGFVPDFLWIDFDGNGRPAGRSPACADGVPALIVHHADRLWGFCPSGAPLPGWTGAPGDSIVDGLAAGDPDGDGYAEVLIEKRNGRVAFLNQDGSPSPGWPRAASNESFRTTSAPLAFDVDGGAGGEVVALDGSGAIGALRADGTRPPGWPLATGIGAGGAPLIADLDRDGRMEVIAPDRVVKDSLQGVVNGRFSSLYGYSLPKLPPGPPAIAWPMLGGDPGRTATLAGSRAPVAPPATPGPLVAGSLRAYPNPARRHPVSFAYQLSEAADVDFTILDSSGHEVASFTRSGRRAENLEVWDPGRVPAGLYVARLRFRGAGGTQSEVITLGLLR